MSTLNTKEFILNGMSGSLSDRINDFLVSTEGIQVLNVQYQLCMCCCNSELHVVRTAFVTYEQLPIGKRLLRGGNVPQPFD